MRRKVFACGLAVVAILVAAVTGFSYSPGEGQDKSAIGRTAVFAEEPGRIWGEDVLSEYGDVLTNSSNRWLDGAFARDLDWLDAKITATLNDGSEYSYKVILPDARGIYIRPMASMLGLTLARPLQKLSAFKQTERPAGKTPIDTGPWGVPGSSMLEIKYRTDLTFLPGARVPEFMLSSWNSGIRSGGLPVTGVSQESLPRTTTTPQAMADVTLFFAEGNILIREVVYWYMPDRQGWIAGHMFDFVYEDENYKYPAKMLLKIVPFVGVGYIFVGSDHSVKAPGNYGVTFEYGVNTYNNYRDSWTVDHVLVHEFPEKAYFDPVSYGHVSEEGAVREVKLVIEGRVDGAPLKDGAYGTLWRLMNFY